MSLFNEIAIFFQGMSWIVGLLLLLGYVFIVIELFQPGFGIFGIIGCAIIALGTVLRVSVGDGNIYAQIFIIIFMESIGVLVAFIALLMTSKNGWVKRSPFPESKQEKAEEKAE
jgi:membrane-bound ClpP family serine protease